VIPKSNPTIYREIRPPDVVSMMSAEKIDAAPILASGPIDAEKPAQ
jgi:hypothetical protein